MGAVADLPILPLAGPAPELTERIDAARNRAKILAAAKQLIDERGIEQVSVDDVAKAASVGKGTIYRRFGDRAGLAFALLGEQERGLQDELIRGRPPLGPGAPAHDRLVAFGEAYLDFLDEHADLLSAAEAGMDWLAGGGPVSVYRTHLVVLLRQAAPGCDADVGAAVLMHCLRPALYLHLRRDQGIALDRIKAGWRAQVAAWVS